MDQDFNGDSADSLTGKTDYLRVRRCKTVYKDGSSEYYGGNNFPRNTGQTTHHKSMCYLAIPGGINAQYQPVYQQTNLGIGGAAAVSALNSGTTFESVAATIQDAAAAILPEFAASAFVSGANAVSGFLGVGGNLSTNALEGLTSGRVFNPYIEQIFNQMNFRNHSFSFKMMARNVKEAQEIKNIITYLKVGAHPTTGANVPKGQDYGVVSEKLTGKSDNRDKNEKGVEGTKNLKDFIEDFNGTTLAGQRFFGIPDQYELAFMRMKPNSGEFDNVTEGIPYANASSVNQNLTLHYKMDKCICSGFSVNYTPDNQYTAMKRINNNMIQVPAVVMQIQFTEVRLLSQADIIAGY